MTSQKPLKIGIIGAGFSGTALAAVLHRLTTYPIEIILFEKTGHFGMGDAYRTPYPFHLLNVKAHDMSAFEDEPHHFSDWITANTFPGIQFDDKTPISDQYVPRFIYQQYLTDLLQTIKNDAKQQTKITFTKACIKDLCQEKDKVKLILEDNSTVIVDKAIFALGNQPPIDFPFPVENGVEVINNPWDYEAPTHIPTQDPVLIVGTGLSMIDTVLTLYHHQHQAPIYAVSRHGLLPLAHASIKTPYALTQGQLKKPFFSLMKYLRRLTKDHMQAGGDWREVMIALRPLAGLLWEQIRLPERKQFLRHLLPYWNIHRHRIHADIAYLLETLVEKKQLHILAGRVQGVKRHEALVKLRQSQKITTLPVKWVINCLGPALTLTDNKSPLIEALLKKRIALLDPLALGLDVDSKGALKDSSHQASKHCYVIGSLRRGALWESSAVPDIRKQCFLLATHLLHNNKDRYERESKNTG